jgi:hypothetical protein
MRAYVRALTDDAENGCCVAYVVDMVRVVQRTVCWMARRWIPTDATVHGPHSGLSEGDPTDGQHDFHRAWPGQGKKILWYVSLSS